MAWQFLLLNTVVLEAVPRVFSQGPQQAGVIGLRPQAELWRMLGPFLLRVVMVDTGPVVEVQWLWVARLSVGKAETGRPRACRTI